MFALPTMLKVGAVVVVLLVVGALLWTVRNELIAKGRALVEAEDNAALVKAQAEQKKRDDLLIASQNTYIADLQNQGERIKETIRYVTVPATACKDDGRTDPRLGQFNEWLRSRGADNNGQAAGRPALKGAVPAPGRP